MGNCCGQRVMEKEISEAKSIAGLIELFTRRREKLADEVEEIKAFLKDDTKKIKSFNMEVCYTYNFHSINTIGP